MPTLSASSCLALCVPQYVLLTIPIALLLRRTPHRHGSRRSCGLSCIITIAAPLSSGFLLFLWHSLCFPWHRQPTDGIMHNGGLIHGSKEKIRLGSLVWAWTLRPGLRCRLLLLAKHDGANRPQQRKPTWAESAPSGQRVLHNGRGYR